MKFLIILSLLLPLICLSSESNFFDYLKKEYRFNSFKDILYFETKLKSKAYLAIEEQIKTNTNFKITYDIHNPSAKFCLSLKGEERIWKDSVGNEYSMCQFDDGSVLKTWDLMKKLGQK